MAHDAAYDAADLEQAAPATCRCGDAACPQGQSVQPDMDARPAAVGPVLDRLDLIVAELDGLPHVVQTCREAAAEICSLQETESLWLSRFADIREASGIGAGPMLSEVPAALAALRKRAEGAPL